MTVHNEHSIQKQLLKLANPETAAHSQRFFKTGKGEYGEGDIFLGIRVPVLRKIAKQHKASPQKTVLQSLKSKYHEERLLALFILVLQFEKGDESARSSIYKLYLNNTKHINNWDLVDCSSHKIIGAFLLEKSRDPLYKLAKSKDLWKRRIAIIATYRFIKHKDFVDILSISEMLIDNKEDLIHKAIGWMLREVGKQDIDTEINFLNTHYKNMPRTMLRYAIEKFPENLRQDYLKGHV